MANPKATTLFHFTKTLNVLKSILNGGFHPRYSLEDVSWLGYDKNQFVAFPIVCFCDIPLSRITEHVDFYGHFGLGMTRPWGQSRRLNPLAYVSKNSMFEESLADNLRTATKADKAEIVRNTIAFTKPVAGTMTVSGKPVQKEFYQESEWRYVARHDTVPDCLVKKDFDDAARLGEANALAAENSTLEFSPSDVKYIFVDSDADIPELVNFINSEMDRFPSADLKVLTSRILSLRTIEEDI